MIDRDRLIRLFTELVSINSPSRGEREVCRCISEKLRALGFDPKEDDVGEKIGGNTGCLYTYIEGSLPLPPLLFSAHMDTVEPSCGKKAVFHPDGKVTSDGTTVLGADDLSGICAILEALTALKESGKPHRPLEILFDPAEETYCAGIQQFDFKKLRSREAYILDLTGPVGSAALQAPAILSYKAVFHGKAAHAAFSPEKGIHALKAAAEAVSAIDCGRIGDTTVNVGTISGGSADNVVPEFCTVTGEVRSFSDESARSALDRIRQQMECAAAHYGASLSFTTETLCLAFRVDAEEPVARRFQNACRELFLPGTLLSTYGGSDNNHFFQHGIRGLVAASGMNNCHSCSEYTSVSELMKASELTLALMLRED